ncbi:MAG: energy-coupling factor transporter ATPase [Clostridia bacterium]|nr:energy-coupling factor transporter ATPase [Clostridia bacterium]
MPIEVRNLTHVYMPGTPFEKKALDDVSFTIGDGEFVGLIGHTGSGKSTLIMHLNGLLKPTSGDVIVDGLSLTQKGVSLRSVREHVGLVFQYPEYQLFEETVVADVMFGPKNLSLSEGDCRARAEEALRLVGLDEPALWEKSPFELSGGQKRRVAIAGVLAMKPNTLILDEPTAGLDPRGRDGIMALMKDIHAAGTTLVMVSHSMTDVSRLCGRILVMNRARLAIDAAPAEVFADAARLREAGLNLPPCALLAERLREAGFSGIPREAYTQETVSRAILAALGRGDAACR